MKEVVVKRWSIVAKDNDWDMYPTLDGMFVEYADYALLGLLTDKIVNELDHVRLSESLAHQKILQLAAENTELRRRLGEK